jgi:uncharacterized integral membrane protein
VRYLSWIITIPVALVVVSFAVSNRDPVELALWPLPNTLVAPTYLAALIALLVGFLLGGLIAWSAQRRYRGRARVRGSRVAELERELVTERNQRMAAEKRLTEAAQNLAAGGIPALPGGRAALAGPTPAQLAKAS